MTRIPLKFLLAPRPGTVRRRLKELAVRHQSVRVLMAIVDWMFELDIGSLHVTVQTQSLLYPNTIFEVLRSHRKGDWGDVSEFQQRFNDTAFILGRGTVHSIRTAEEQEVHVLSFDCCCVTRGLKRRTLVCVKSELYHRTCECVWVDNSVELIPPNVTLLPSNVMKALKAMLAYLWAEELPHYDTSTPEERSRHILKSLTIVSDWLNGRTEPTDLDRLVAELSAEDD